METLFMSFENSKTNESNKFRYYHTDKLNLKNPSKNIPLVFITNAKTFHLHITTTNVRYLPQPGMMKLICLMDHILYLIFKIILNTLLKTTRL